MRKMSPSRRRLIFLTAGCWLLAVFLSGCAFFKPHLSEVEIQRKNVETEIERMQLQLDNLNRVNNVGYRLLMNLPKIDRLGDFIFSGLLLAEVDKVLSEIYQIEADKGVVVVGVVNDSPAKGAGVSPGDLITRIEGLAASGLADVVYVLNRKAPGQELAIDVLRRGVVLKFTFRLGNKPLDVSFRLVDTEEVNSGTTASHIVTTRGLMQFLQSNDELAVVLANELAHIIKSHYTKDSGIELISTIAGAAVEIGIDKDKAVPVTEDKIMQAFDVKYSLDSEKAADAFGLKYAYLAGFDIEAGAGVWERLRNDIPEAMTSNFFNAHPMSPERMLGIQKIIRDLKADPELKEKIKNHPFQSAPK